MLTSRSQYVLRLHGLLAKYIYHALTIVFKIHGSMGLTTMFSTLSGSITNN